jgi:tryptophanyl-tRNA synthetase
VTSLASTVEHSTLLRADIADHLDRYRVLIGECPTGPLHLGHYFGTVAERDRLHDLGMDTFIILADYQVITDREAIGDVRDNVHNAVLDYLAARIDPSGPRSSPIRRCRR